MSELIAKYPRILAFLFAASLAGMAADLVFIPLRDNSHLIVYAIAAMVSTGFWVAIIGNALQM